MKYSSLIERLTSLGGKCVLVIIFIIDSANKISKLKFLHFKRILKEMFNYFKAILHLSLCDPYHNFNYLFYDCLIHQARDYFHFVPVLFSNFLTQWLHIVGVQHKFFQTEWENKWKIQFQLKIFLLFIK